MKMIKIKSLDFVGDVEIMADGRSDSTNTLAILITPRDPMDDEEIEVVAKFVTRACNARDRRLMGGE